jgi:hypothetical protein
MEGRWNEKVIAELRQSLGGGGEETKKDRIGPSLIWSEMIKQSKALRRRRRRRGGGG